MLPQIKEYERVWTTVVNAYVEPIVRRYLTRLEARLGEAGFTGSCLSSCRMAAWRRSRKPRGWPRAPYCPAPPAAWPADGAARTWSAFPISSRSTWAAPPPTSRWCRAGRPRFPPRPLAGQRIALQSLDIASIGAGGGSIASVDAGGTLQVGPESAGAVPGPACYGNGGPAATVTDANLVLGYLDAAAFLGGKRPLDRAAAEAAVDRIADGVDLSRIEAAAGIHRLVNLTWRMASGW